MKDDNTLIPGGGLLFKSFPYDRTGSGGGGGGGKGDESVGIVEGAVDFDEQVSLFLLWTSFNSSTLDKPRL